MTVDTEPFRRLLAGHIESFGPAVFDRGPVLAEAGIDAVVLGPGDIGQAHAAGDRHHADLGWPIVCSPRVRVARPRRPTPGQGDLSCGSASIGKPAGPRLLELFRAEHPEAATSRSATPARPGGRRAGHRLPLPVRAGLGPVVVFGRSRPSARAPRPGHAARLQPAVRCQVVDADPPPSQPRQRHPAHPHPAGRPHRAADALARLATRLGSSWSSSAAARSAAQGKPASLSSTSRPSWTTSPPGVLPHVRPLCYDRWAGSSTPSPPDDRLRHSPSICSALFYHRKGAGTLIRRGSTVRRHATFDQIDRTRLEG
jgi:hypothetical protein